MVQSLKRRIKSKSALMILFVIGAGFAVFLQSCLPTKQVEVTRLNLKNPVTFADSVQSIDIYIKHSEESEERVYSGPPLDFQEVFTVNLSNYTGGNIKIRMTSFKTSSSTPFQEFFYEFSIVGNKVNPLASIQFDVGSLALDISLQNFDLSPYVQIYPPESIGNISYAASSDTVILLNPKTGVLRLLKPGTVFVIVELNNTTGDASSISTLFSRDTLILTVTGVAPENKNPTAMSVSLNRPQILVGESTTLTNQILPLGVKATAICEANDTAVVNLTPHLLLNSKYSVSGKKPGKTTITCTVTENKSLRDSVDVQVQEVQVKGKLDSVRFTAGDSLSFEVGKVLQLSYVAKPDSIKPATRLLSTNPQCAEVLDGIQVKGIAACASKIIVEAFTTEATARDTLLLWPKIEDKTSFPKWISKDSGLTIEAGQSLILDLNGWIINPQLGTSLRKTLGTANLSPLGIYSLQIPVTQTQNLVDVLILDFVKEGKSYTDTLILRFTVVPIKPLLKIVESSSGKVSINPVKPNNIYNLNDTLTLSVKVGADSIVSHWKGIDNLIYQSLRKDTVKIILSRSAIIEPILTSSGKIVLTFISADSVAYLETEAGKQVNITIEAKRVIGKTFRGWYLDSAADPVTSWSITSQVFDKSTTLYAIYTESPIYHVTFKDAEYFDVISTTTESSKLRGIPRLYTYVNWKGWNTDLNGLGKWIDSNTIITQDYTVYAIYTPIVITYHPLGGTNYTLDANKINGTIEFPRNQDTVSSETKRFMGFSTNNIALTGDLLPTHKFTENVHVYPIYRPIYRITYASNGETSGRLPLPQVADSTQETINLQPNDFELKKDGFQFLGWNTQKDGLGDFYLPRGLYARRVSDTLYPHWEKWISQPGGLIDPDGNKYQTLVLGNQEWTLSNIRTTQYRDGTPLLTQKGEWLSKAFGGLYAFPDSAIKPDMQELTGAFYNKEAVSNKKFVPTGWRIPDTTDFVILRKFLIAKGLDYDGSREGEKIAWAMADTSLWFFNKGVYGSPGYQRTENNKSGFSGIPSGYRAGGVTSKYRSLAAWWTRVSANSKEFQVYGLEYARPDLFSYTSSPDAEGFAVRLVRDVE